jgi:hypothetical protein
MSTLSLPVASLSTVSQPFSLHRLWAGLRGWLRPSASADLPWTLEVTQAEIDADLGFGRDLE